MTRRSLASRYVARGTSANLFLTLAARVGAAAPLGMLLHVILARVLGVAGYGVFSYVTEWLNTAALLATAGFEQGSFRFVSTYRAKHNWQLLWGYLACAQRVVICAGLSLTMIGYLVISLLGENLPQEVQRGLGYGLPIIPILALLAIQSSTMRGLGGGATALLPQLLVMPASLTVMAVGLAFGSNAGAHHAIILSNLATLMAYATAVVLQRSLQAGIPKDGGARFETALWIRSGGVILIYQIASALGNRGVVLLLGTISGTVATGYYVAGTKLANVLFFPTMAVTSVYSPLVASHHATNSASELQKDIGTMLRWNMVTVLPTAVVLLVFNEQFLFLFGADFQAASEVVIVLVVRSVLICPVRPAAAILLMLGEEKAAATIQSIANAVGLIAALPLIWLMAESGAAVAVAAMDVVTFYAMAVYLHFRVGISCWKAILKR